ncbi:MAG TPA: hypothetical protein VFQ06_15790, partial [Nitrospira sp.]|nr:hypothetical protein [Nitrospira sp.]
ALGGHGAGSRECAVVRFQPGMSLSAFFASRTSTSTTTRLTSAVDRTVFPGVDRTVFPGKGPTPQ